MNRPGGRIRVALFSVGAVAITLFLVGPSFCAMGTRNALPTNWSLGATYGYPTRANLSGNPMSAMCVACHTANPSVSTPSPVSLPFDDIENAYRGSHFVVNQYAGVDPTLRTTDVANQAVEKTTAWTTSGALSRYGDIANFVSLTTQGQLICESCHNIVSNYNPKLLLEVFSGTNGDATLCEGCHSTVRKDAPPFNHHPMTPMSGNHIGPHDGQTTAHPLTVGHLTPQASSLTGGVAFYSGAFAMSCVSCHRPHDAMTATGARILRRGNIRAGTFREKSVNTQYYDNKPISGYLAGAVVDRAPSGVTATGLHRLSDMTDGLPLVFNQDPLCNACH